MNNKFYDTDYTEQESTVNIDYFNREISIYTCRKAVYNRILKKIGNPTKTYYINNLISGARWNISFTDSRAVKIFSKKLLIRKYKINYIFNS